MRRNLFLPFIAITLFILSSSCERNDERLTGQISLSSAFDFETASVYGYNFDLAKKVRYPSADKVLPDLLLFDYRKVDGTILPGFASPSNEYGFARHGESFSSLTAAREYFNGLHQPDSNALYVAESDTVRLYDIWVLKTAAENYVKLLVLDVDVVEDPQSKHLEVRVDFVYQPDGTNQFKE